MITYSQHGEDLALLEISSDVNKTFIDIGALDGITNSNCKIFYDLGWECILVEPHPESFRKLDINVKGIDHCHAENVAISDVEGSVSFIADKIPGHSRISNNGSGNIKVDAKKFKYLIDKYPNFKDLGIIDIDVEGNEINILKSMFETEVRPAIILIEHRTPIKDGNKKIGVADNYNEIFEILNDEYELYKHIKCNLIWKKRK